MQLYSGSMFFCLLFCIQLISSNAGGHPGVLCVQNIHTVNSISCSCTV